MARKAATAAELRHFVSAASAAPCLAVRCPWTARQLACGALPASDPGVPECALRGCPAAVPRVRFGLAASLAVSPVAVQWAACSAESARARCRLFARTQGFQAEAPGWRANAIGAA